MYEDPALAGCDEEGCSSMAEVECAFHHLAASAAPIKVLCRNHAHIVGEPGSSKAICGDCLAAAGAVK